MRTKLISFKPLQDGKTTIYLDKGINLHSLVDMAGKEIDIEFAVGAVINEIDEATKALFTIIQAYGNQQYIHGREAGLREEAEKEDAIKELEI